MQTERFKVENVKCGGCVTAIKNGLGTLAQVHSVAVTVEDGAVVVEGEGLSRQVLSMKLAELGYPEASG